MAATVTAIPPPFFSPYLDDQCNKISSKPVPWEVRPVRESAARCRADHALQGYQRAKLLSNDELSLLKSLSKLVSISHTSEYG
jgi:V-type H+-transporting ATPase subunit H